MEKIIVDILGFIIGLLKPTIMEQLGPVISAMIALLAIGVVIYGIYRRGSTTIAWELGGVLLLLGSLVGLLIAFR